MLTSNRIAGLKSDIGAGKATWTSKSAAITMFCCISTLFLAKNNLSIKFPKSENANFNLRAGIMILTCFRIVIMVFEYKQCRKFTIPSQKYVLLWRLSVSKCPNYLTLGRDKRRWCRVFKSVSSTPPKNKIAQSLDFGECLFLTRFASEFRIKANSTQRLHQYNLPGLSFFSEKIRFILKFMNFKFMKMTKKGSKKALC